VDSVPIERIKVSAFVVPTDSPESDGTAEWDRTTLVLVEIHGGGKVGIGYTYADRATATFVDEVLSPALDHANAIDIPRAHVAMRVAARNHGALGVAAMAISAVDVALWDLKAKVLDVSLATLLGTTRESVMIYGSGGFTSYSDERLASQLGGWASQGLRAVKMKVGRESARDPERVAVARRAIGPDVALFVDANGGYSAKEALRRAEQFATCNVTWFEEPVSSDCLDDLALLRMRLPAGMDVAAGEYGYDAMYFRRMLAARAVDVLQADATRCGGVTGFLEASALCIAFGSGLSAHCAPALHVALGCASPVVRHLEYFHDHVRIESMLFDGAPAPAAGALAPDRSRKGLGLEFKHADAARYAV
jgi:L-alanine-DL-glutamate epimerase-like enolase superfamily enzyme